MMPMKIAQPDRLIFVGVIALLLWLPLPWGSHRPWAEGLFTAGVGMLLAGWWARRPLDGAATHRPGTAE